MNEQDEIKILYWGASKISSRILEGLVNEGLNIIGVVTYVDRPKGRGRKLEKMPVKKVALKMGLKVIELDEIRSEATRLFEGLNPDLGIIMGFGILPKELYEYPRLGTVNLHPSMLPELRGAAPIKWALINGYEKTGLTTFFLIDKVDAGNIVLQEEIDISPDMNAGELTDIIVEMGIKILVRTVNVVAKGDYKLIKQDDSRVTKAPKLKKEDFILDWNLTANEIHNRVRAFSPTPGAITSFRENRIKIFETKLCIEIENGDPGEIIEISKKAGVCVSTGKGIIAIKQLQPEGKKRMDAQSFTNGYRVQLGEFFK